MTSKTIQMKYVSEDREDARAELVARQDFPTKLFKGVACDESSKVKLAMIENHELQAEVVSKLCTDKDIEVRTKAYNLLCNAGGSKEDSDKQETPT